MKYSVKSLTKRILCTASVIALMASCESGGSSGGGGGSSNTQTTTTTQTTSDTVTAKNTKTVTFDSSNPSIEVDTSVKTLTINGLSGQDGKAVYLVKVNNTSTDISASKVRYVTGVSGITLPSSSSDVSAERSVLSESADTHSCEEGCLVLGVDENAEFVAPMRSVSADVTDYSVGNTKYITNPLSSSNKLQIKLLAKTTHAYIWGATTDGYTESNFTTASTFAEKFEDIYLLDRTLLGNESDLMYSSSSSLASMNTLSDTGTMINIVFFKMEDTYNGLYWKNDSYNNSSSNKGKYIYINSKNAVESPNQIILTMAHEFSHMILNNQKAISRVAAGKSALSAPTAYDEMLAELAKDVTCNYFGIGNTDNASIRFKTFNRQYCAVGITGYDSTNYYYSTNFAFGAWVCRNYGGAKLVREMMQNASVGDDSIVSAVNSLNGTNYTMNQLIAQFVQAITMPDSSYSLNKEVTSDIFCSGLSSGSDYFYKQSAINIFDLSSIYGGYTPTNATERFAMRGPMLLTAMSQNLSYDAYTSLKSSHGVTLHKIGTVSSGSSSATITFSQTGSPDLTMYVMIGESRKIYGE